MKRLVPLIILALVITVAVLVLVFVPQDGADDEIPSFGSDSEIGKACIFSSDCVTPMSYAVRSSCPFTSFCIDGACRVACPSYYPEPEACYLDSDCDCSFYDSEERLDCRCADGICAAVVA